MKAGWTTLTCGVVLGGALGFVGGQVAAWTRGPDRATTADTVWNSDALPPPPPADVTAGAPAVISDDQTVYFPEATPAQAVRAEGFSGVGDSHGGDSSGTTSEPATLPGANDAQPINVREDQERHNLRRLIDAEMGTISDQDREVWEDVLRGLPAEDALGILRMWQRFGQGAAGDKPGLPATLPSGLPPLVPRDNSATFVPGSRTAPPPHAAAAADPVRAELVRARAILVNNLLNADSPGFRRTEPVFADLSPGDSKRAAEGQPPQPGSVPVPPGVQLAGQRLDLAEGNYERTGGTFDLVIQGDGFFVVREADRQFYTRCGRFRINADRRLVHSIGGSELLLDPEIVIPGDAFDVFVDSSGNVSAKTPAANQPVKLGRISLARFLDPTGLIPAGRCLLAAGPSAGAMRRAAPGDGAGSIMQGHLESSNVDRDQERERVQQLDELLDLLATSPR